MRAAETGLGDGPGQSKDPRLSIGAFGRRSLLSMKALRLYDQMGLLSPAEVDPVNGYRWYREHQLETARLISTLRRIEMPLAEVADLLAAEPAARSQVLLRYWELIEHRHAANRETVAYLESKLAGNAPPIRQFEIRERDVPSQRVLSIQRHVAVNDITDFIGGSLNRLMGIAVTDGGVSGPPFVVYHGAVNEEGDGPVEVCVPVAEAMGDRPEFATRIEPDHREGYTVIRKAQVAFPQILSAYDAVWQWAADTGRTIIGSPREIYFGDFMSAGPHDEICDIAVPVLSLSTDEDNSDDQSSTAQSRGEDHA